MCTCELSDSDIVPSSMLEYLAEMVDTALLIFNTNTTIYII